MRLSPARPCSRSGADVSGGEPDRALREFVIAEGLARAEDDIRWTALAGGVSSDIWRVDLPQGTICIKRALARLKVAQDWRAPVARNAFEWRWLCFAAQCDRSLVPQPIAHDEAIGALAMAFLDPVQHPVWKSQLMDGIADGTFAGAVGAALGALHAASANDAEIARTFATDAIFHAIRLEPYLLATAAKHGDVATELLNLVQRTAATKVALVHGDVSPKNILVGRHGPVFLDAECAWYGDPAFDLAFCLNHLLLKCMVHRDLSNAYLACFESLASSYGATVTWEDKQSLERRTATLLPGLLLARVDGKSPVEYLTSDRDRAFVRNVARDGIVRAPASLSELADRWAEALRRYQAPA